MKKTINLILVFLLSTLMAINFSCEKPTEDLVPNNGGSGGGGGGNGGGGGGGGGGTAPTVTTPDTYFIDEYRTFSSMGAYWYQQFTVSTTTRFALRGASTFACDFA